MNRVDLDLIRITQEIAESCGYSFANIIEQIRVDIDRMDVFYQNNTEPLTLDTIVNLGLPMSVLMLCTQASFYYLFYEIHERYTMPGQIVVENTDRPSIKIMQYDNRFVLLFKKSFQVVDSESLEQLNIFYTYAIADGNKMTIMFIDRRS